MATLSITRHKNASGTPVTGYITNDDGTTIATFSADTTLTVSAGQFIVYNNDTVTVAGVAAGTFGAIANTTDLTTDANVNLILIGRVSDTPDPHTGSLHMVGWHANIHTTPGRAHAKSSVGRVHAHPHNSHKWHWFGNVGFTMGTPGAASAYASTLSFFATSASIVLDDGTTRETTNSSCTVNAGDHLIYYAHVNGAASLPAITLTTRDGTTINQGEIRAIPSSVDVTALDNNLWYIGSVSATPDTHTGLLYVKSHVVNAHQSHGAHHASKSVGKTHNHPSQATHGHFKNCLFSVSSGGFSQLTVAGIGGQTPQYVNDNGVVHNLATGATTATYADPIFLFDTSVAPVSGTVPFSAFIQVPAGTDLTQATYINCIKIGHTSTSLDPQTGQPILHGHHHGSHQVHGSHIHQDAVVGTHIQTHALTGGIGGTKEHYALAQHHRRHDTNKKPHRHHFYHMVMTMSSPNYGAGTTSVTLAPEPGAASWELRDDSGTFIYGSASSVTLTSVPIGSQIMFNPTGSAIVAGGVTFPASGFNAIGGGTLGSSTAAPDLTASAFDLLVQVGRVNSVPDQHTGQYGSHGHHVGHHQTHGKSIALAAIGRAHANPNNSHKHTFRHLNMRTDGPIYSGGFATTTTSVYLEVDSGATGWVLGDDTTSAVLASGSSNVTLTPVNFGSIIVYNFGAGAVTLGGVTVNAGTFGAIPSGTDISGPSGTFLAIVGHVGNFTDSVSGQIPTHGHHNGHHKTHGKHHATGSVKRVAVNIYNPGSNSVTSSGFSTLGSNFGPLWTISIPWAQMSNYASTYWAIASNLSGSSGFFIPVEQYNYDCNGQAGTFPTVTEQRIYMQRDAGSNVSAILVGVVPDPSSNQLQFKVNLYGNASVTTLYLYMYQQGVSPN